jgi:hypothetical protein
LELNELCCFKTWTDINYDAFLRIDNGLAEEIYTLYRTVLKIAESVLEKTLFVEEYARLKAQLDAGAEELKRSLGMASSEQEEKTKRSLSKLLLVGAMLLAALAMVRFFLK